MVLGKFFFFAVQHVQQPKKKTLQFMWERMWFEVINQSGVGQWLQSPLERVSDFSKISYKTKNLLKKKEKKKKL